ncbi:MAG: hypothetical protein QT03_C0001G0977 [archaeon GW2011_AR10]|nr:MAG: hypothetical protein QT03_C0001G0977 [archaeon GW2011_AR10]
MQKETVISDDGLAVFKYFFTLACGGAKQNTEKKSDSAILGYFPK